MILEGHDEEIARWFQERTGEPFVPAHRAIGLVSSANVLEGAVLIQLVNRWTINAHMYSEAPSLAPYTRGVFRWLFDNASRVTAICPKSSVMRRHYPRLGFKYECTAKDYYGPSKHGLQYAMSAEQCRWINGPKF